MTEHATTLDRMSPRTFQEAQDELFSHLLRSGIAAADPGYLAGRYPALSESSLRTLHAVGEAYLRRAASQGDPVMP
jgi:hypothetical protein